MVGCGLACPGGGGAGVSGCEFRGSGWGWDRIRGLGVCRGWRGGGVWGTHTIWGGGGSNTEHGTIYVWVLWSCGRVVGLVWGWFGVGVNLG